MHCVKPINKKKSISQDRRRSVLAIVGDTQVGLWVVRSLARNGLTVHAIVNTDQGQVAHSRFTTSAWPLDSRPGSDGFSDEMLELSRNFQVGSIMPVSECAPKGRKEAVMRPLKNRLYYRNADRINRILSELSFK